MLSPGPHFQLLEALVSANVDFIVVGGMAAVLSGVPIVTADLDIVHQRNAENADRLLDVLRNLRSYVRADLSDRKLFPSPAHLLGRGHINLMTDLGPLDLLCEIANGLGYEQLLPDSEWVVSGGARLRVLSLPKLIEVKSQAGRLKDRMAIPVLLATLEELRRNRP